MSIVRFLGKILTLLYHVKSLRIVRSNATLKQVFLKNIKEWVDIYEKTK